MVQPRILASSSHASDSGSRCRKRLMRRGLDSIGMTFKLCISKTHVVLMEPK